MITVSIFFSILVILVFAIVWRSIPCGDVGMWVQK